MTRTAAAGHDDELLTPRAVAARWKVSLETVRRWIRKGIIGHTRGPGGVVRIPASEVERHSRFVPGAET